MHKLSASLSFISERPEIEILTKINYVLWNVGGATIRTNFRDVKVQNSRFLRFTGLSNVDVRTFPDQVN